MRDILEITFYDFPKKLRKSRSWKLKKPYFSKINRLLNSKSRFRLLFDELFESECSEMKSALSVVSSELSSGSFEFLKCFNRITWKKKLILGSKFRDQILPLEFHEIFGKTCELCWGQKWTRRKTIFTDLEVVLRFLIQTLHWLSAWGHSYFLEYVLLPFQHQYIYQPCCKVLYLTMMPNQGHLCFQLKTRVKIDLINLKSTNRSHFAFVLRILSRIWQF